MKTDQAREKWNRRYAEADPRMDVDGSDAAQKLAILSHLAFGARVPWREIPRRGIEAVEVSDLRFQIVQQTAPYYIEDYFTAVGRVPASYVPGGINNLALLRSNYAQERADRFRRAYRLAPLPRLVRRAIWWSFLNVSGAKEYCYWSKKLFSISGCRRREFCKHGGRVIKPATANTMSSQKDTSTCRYRGIYLGF